jgi:hypothetical protein
MDGPSHERARVRAAERLDGPLDPTEAAWLNEHLAGCEACTAVARSYEADRAALRGLRAYEPEAPRDLWARTSAAIERESGRRAGAQHSGTSQAPTAPRRRLPALGVLSGVTVIAVVIGATALSGAFLNGPSTGLDANPSGSAVAVTPPTPGPTPIVVAAGDVGWVDTANDGNYAVNRTTVDEVCAHDQQPDCAPVKDDDSKPVTINVKPKSINQSPTRDQAVVVGTNPAGGGDSVLVIALPTKEPSASPSPSPTPVATATAGPSSTPTATATVSTTVKPPASAPPASEPPTSQPPTEPPASEAPATATPSPTPRATPLPSSVAIASGVKVVGQSAAYSPSGMWFAFTARPSDGSAGPDIYVWHLGEEKAKQVTTDHTSVFASWIGSQMLGSRLAPDSKPGVEAQPQSFFLDPSDGTEKPIAGAVWRPVVDPTGHWDVAWEGTVKLSDDGLTIVPATGSLVLRRFQAGVGPDLTEAAPTVVADGTSPEFDARWDETGTWLAVWVADPADASFGRLSLNHVKPETGKLSRPAGAPVDVAALPGFSIADSRLAWATPPGQGGEGSRIQIVAWSNENVGSLESGPGQDFVIIH